MDWVNIAQGGYQLWALLCAVKNQELNKARSNPFSVHLSDFSLLGKGFVPLNLKYCRVWEPVIMHLYDQLHSDLDGVL